MYSNFDTIPALNIWKDRQTDRNAISISRSARQRMLASEKVDKSEKSFFLDKTLYRTL